MTWFGGSLQAQGLNRAAPKAWGVVKGGAATVVIFEDAGGTIRLYEAQTGMVFATITRE
jgi:hypothetical protein